MEEIEKVLIITYYWPPSGGGGVQRWLKFSKYLPDFAWQPYIFTPLNPSFSLNDKRLEREVGRGVRVIKKKIWEPYKISGIKGNAGINESKGTIKNNLAKWVRANLLLPDPRVFWVKGSITFLKKLIIDENIKVVVTTGPPHSMHLIGAGLKNANKNIKWIADFRDPMVQFNFYQKLSPTKCAIERLKRIERRILDNADRVLATSKSTKEFLEHFEHTKFVTITNGWDTDDFKKYRDLSIDNDKYVLLHPGSIKSDRSPKELFKFLNRAVQAGLIDSNKFELRLIGNIDVSIINEIEKFSHLKDVVSIIGYVNHEELITVHYAEANGLLLLINNSQSSKANIPGKLFEYMATQKPILAFGADDDDAIELLHSGGVKTFRYEDELSLEDMDRAMNLRPQIDFEKYNRKSLTKAFVQVLNDLM